VGAVEHLKTLCCLGLPPESAMIAVTPLLHKIIPHGWSRMGLYESDATMGSSVYAENPAMAFYLERFWGFLNDPSDIMGSLYLPNFRATGIGWTLHRQGAGLPGWRLVSRNRVSSRFLLVPRRDDWGSRADYCGCSSDPPSQH
jgi:hypothetical protein